MRILAKIIERASWSDGLDYFYPSNATPGLQAWGREMITKILDHYRQLCI